MAGSDVLFHKRLDVGKDLLAVELEEELVAGGGVEFDGDMPDAGVAQALGGPFDPFAAAAHRVVRAGEEEQGQVFGHLRQQAPVAQAGQTGEEAVVPVEGEAEAAPLVGQVAVYLAPVAVEPVLGGAGRREAAVVAAEGHAVHQLAAVMPALEGRQYCRA